MTRGAEGGGKKESLSVDKKAPSRRDKYFTLWSNEGGACNASSPAR